MRNLQIKIIVLYKMMLQIAKGLDTIPDNKDIFKRMQQIVL